MPGRGVDQALPTSVPPILYERYVTDARIVNLETALTTCDLPWPGKPVHYRMHPANVELLTCAGIDVAVLANNHVLDWSRAGLRETLAVLDRAGIAPAGAGTDPVIVSLHWGPNWGYDAPAWQRAFAHRLIDAGAADLVHGHSSHHPKGIEVHEDRAILYGAGDLLNDYEGIRGHAAYRPDLSLLYLPTLDADGALVSLELLPLRTRRFRLERAPAEDAQWLAATVGRASRDFGVGIELASEGRLALRWR